MRRTASLIAALALVAGCADPNALTPAERTGREVALTQRQLELLQLDGPEVVALYGAADAGTASDLRWSGGGCDLRVMLDAEGRVAEVSFEHDGSDRAIRACARWL